MKHAFSHEFQAHVTPEDIREEDMAALASLTPQQRDALARLSMATRLTHFNGGTREGQLMRLHTKVAESRNANITSSICDMASAN